MLHSPGLHGRKRRAEARPKKYSSLLGNRDEKAPRFTIHSFVAGETLRVAGGTPSNGSSERTELALHLPMLAG